MEMAWSARCAWGLAGRLKQMCIGACRTPQADVHGGLQDASRGQAALGEPLQKLKGGYEMVIMSELMMGHAC
eukprot:scaffold308898_cov17-Tisochrysis_lutea.AAC.1